MIGCLDDLVLKGIFNSRFLKHGKLDLGISDFLGVDVDFCMHGKISKVGISFKFGKWVELKCDTVISEEEAVSLL